MPTVVQGQRAGSEWVNSVQVRGLLVEGPERVNRSRIRAMQ